jgi:hypothetical protein
MKIQLAEWKNMITPIGLSQDQHDTSVPFVSAIAQGHRFIYDCAGFRNGIGGAKTPEERRSSPRCPLAGAFLEPASAPELLNAGDRLAATATRRRRLAWSFAFRSGAMLSHARRNSPNPPG